MLVTLSITIRSYLSGVAEQPKLWKRLNNRGKCGTSVLPGINLRPCSSRCLRLAFPDVNMLPL
jgi:hypothetical protein